MNMYCMMDVNVYINIDRQIDMFGTYQYNKTYMYMYIYNYIYILCKYICRLYVCIYVYCVDVCNLYNIYIILFICRYI